MELQTLENLCENGRYADIGIFLTRSCVEYDDLAYFLAYLEKYFGRNEIIGMVSRNMQKNTLVEYVISMIILYLLHFYCENGDIGSYVMSISNYYKGFSEGSDYETLFKNLFVDMRMIKDVLCDQQEKISYIKLCSGLVNKGFFDLSLYRDDMPSYHPFSIAKVISLNNGVENPKVWFDQKMINSHSHHDKSFSSIIALENYCSYIYKCVLSHKVQLFAKIMCNTLTEDEYENFVSCFTIEKVEYSVSQLARHYINEFVNISEKLKEFIEIYEGYKISRIDINGQCDYRWDHDFECLKECKHLFPVLFRRLESGVIGPYPQTEEEEFAEEECEYNASSNEEDLYIEEESEYY